MKGNVLDMAVGIIIGAAFVSIVNSLVKDIIMPPIGYIMGGINFGDLFVSLDGKTYASLAEAQAAAALPLIMGCSSIQLSNFLIVALAIFVLIRQVNALKKSPHRPPRTPRSAHSARRGEFLAAVKCAHCTSDLQLGGNGNSAIISRSSENSGRSLSERRPSILFLLRFQGFAVDKGVAGLRSSASRLHHIRIHKMRLVAGEHVAEGDRRPAHETCPLWAYNARRQSPGRREAHLPSLFPSPPPKSLQQQPRPPAGPATPFPCSLSRRRSTGF